MEMQACLRHYLGPPSLAVAGECMDGKGAGSHVMCWADARGCRAPLGEAPLKALRQLWGMLHHHCTAGQSFQLWHWQRPFQAPYRLYTVSLLMHHITLILPGALFFTEYVSQMPDAQQERLQGNGVSVKFSLNQDRMLPLDSTRPGVSAYL